MNLECPKCGHKWEYKGNHYRAQCMNCRRKLKQITWVKTGLPPKKDTNATKMPPIQDNIMQGGILDVLDKMKRSNRGCLVFD